MKTASAAKAKKSGIRAIDRGTYYDVAGRLSNLARAAAAAQGAARITDALITVRREDGSMTHMHWGVGTRERRHYMLAAANAASSEDFAE